jgi:hypothetical protein
MLGMLKWKKRNGYIPAFMTGCMIIDGAVSE